ncbi:MAG: hypothetical protein ACRCX2_24170 [Paraclostridium sp.]
MKEVEKARCDEYKPVPLKRNSLQKRRFKQSIFEERTTLRAFNNVDEFNCNLKISELTIKLESNFFTGNSFELDEDLKKFLKVFKGEK